MTLAEIKRWHVLATLAECDGNLSEAARRLDIERSSLQRMLRKWRHSARVDSLCSA